MAFNLNPNNMNMNMYAASSLPQSVMTTHVTNLTLQNEQAPMHTHATPPRHHTMHVSSPHVMNVMTQRQTGAPQGYVEPNVGNVDTSHTIQQTDSTGTYTATKTNTSDSKMKPQILEKMKKLRDEGKYCDLVIDVKGFKFRAHRNILAAWSPYFDSQLISDETMINDLLIVNYDNYEVFSDLLDFLYSGNIVPRETNFLQLLHLAVSFQIDLLRNYCEEFLRSNLHLGNFISTYFLARKYKLKSLEEYIVGFLQMNLSDAVKQSEFLSLPANRFNAFLSSGYMETIKPEIKLFLIISWVGFDVRERERYLVLLLRHIDWSTVASDFLLEISRTENFFTTHESSLYLLLQTLFSSGISLGPYTELFPSLRQTYSHLLTDIVHTGFILPEVEDYCPVTVTAVSTRSRRCDAAISTDCQGLINEELTLTPAVEPQNGTVTREFDMEDYSDTYNDSQSESYKKEENVSSPSADEQTTPSGDNKPNKRKGKPRRVKLIISVPPEKSKVNSAGNEKSSPKKKKKAWNTGRGKKKHGQGKKVAKEVKKEEEGNKNEERDDEEEESENVKPEMAEENENNYQSDKDEDEEEMTNDEGEEDLLLEEQKPELGSKVKKLKRGQSKFTYRKRKGKFSSVKSSAFFCDYCEYSAIKLSRLQGHVKRCHESNMTYKCTMCQFVTKWNRQYYEHMRHVHFQGPPYRCDNCDYTSDRIQSLLVHRAKHSDERPHACDQCDTRFRTRNNLLAHIKTHTGLRPFTCTDCGKSFATKNTLEQHMVTHSDDRPYLCDTCGFSTKYQSHLIAHNRIHTGNTFPCSYPKCNYSTPKKSQLKAHMRSHLGIRQFQCQTCGKSFIEKSHLIRHERIHLPEKPFKCSDCSYQTTRPDKLKEHFEKHHGPESTAKVPYKQRKPRERKIKETPPPFPHYDHAGYTMQPPPPNDLETAAFLQDIRMQFSVANNMGSLSIVPISAEQPAVMPNVSMEERLAVVGTPGSTVSSPHTPSVATTQSAIIPEDHQSYVALGVPHGQQHNTQQQQQHQHQQEQQHMQGVPVPLSQAMGQAQQDYGGLSAFMALF